jgi:hypothetical protein
LPPGISLATAGSGFGSGTVTFQVLPNAGGDVSTSFTIAGQTFTIDKEASSIPGLNFIGSMAHLAAEENWTTTFTLVNAVSMGRVNIPATVRDDTGAPIATDTISSKANGHYAFTLVTDRYSATAGIRGTIEFDTPAGAEIGALGIRIPNVAAHTYSTLPALAK